MFVLLVVIIAFLLLALTFERRRRERDDTLARRVDPFHFITAVINLDLA